MIRRPPRSTHCISSAASDVYKRQPYPRSSLPTGLPEGRPHLVTAQSHARSGSVTGASRFLIGLESTTVLYRSPMHGVPLDAIRSTEVRSVFKRALKPELKKLEFKIAEADPRGPSGWEREVRPVREFFWIQLSSYGFFRDSGGEFIVEFVFSNSEHHTAVRDRMWRLLDDSGRQEAVQLSNHAIASLPGPLPEIYGEMPAGLQETSLQRFHPITEIPPAEHDIWFRYATRSDVDAWAEFLASRLAPVVKECEDRLQSLAAGSVMLAGLTKKEGDQKWVRQ